MMFRLGQAVRRHPVYTGWLVVLSILIVLWLTVLVPHEEAKQDRLGQHISCLLRAERVSDCP